MTSQLINRRCCCKLIADYFVVGVGVFVFVALVALVAHVAVLAILVVLTILSNN